MNNYLILNDVRIDLTEEQVEKIKHSFTGAETKLSVKEETVTIGDIEFIRFPEENGRVPILAKDIAFITKFGDSNNLKESTELLAKLDEILQKVIAVVGEENVLEFETDLTALDGTDNYGTMTSKVSLHTLDFYRKNRKIFDKHKVNSFCFTATPDSVSNSLVLCVSPSGDICYNDYCSDNDGVRPLLYLNSSISVSYED